MASVLAEAERIGYRTPSARCSGKQIAVLSPSVSNPYHTKMITGIDAAAHAAGYHTAIYNTYWNPRTESHLLDSLDYSRVAGIIFAMTPIQTAKVRELSRRVPIVAVGDRVTDCGIDTVDVDNFGAAQLVAKHLIDLGHKRIAYLSTALNEHHVSRMRRSEGLQEAYRRWCPEGSVTICSHVNSLEAEITTPDLEYRSGMELAYKCLRNDKITGIVAINDMVAFGVLDALQREGYRVPEDFSLCGFTTSRPRAISASSSRPWTTTPSATARAPSICCSSASRAGSTAARTSRSTAWNTAAGSSCAAAPASRAAAACNQLRKEPHLWRPYSPICVNCISSPMMLRILLAVLWRAGLERERKNRPAGFRTYMLTALGATLTVLLSLQLDQMLHGPWRAVAESIGATQDVSRFGAEAAKGIGFLGAGTIIITARQQVKGLTTAAGLWASACLGLAIGAGFYLRVHLHRVHDGLHVPAAAAGAAAHPPGAPHQHQPRDRAHGAPRRDRRASARREHPHFRLCRQPQRHGPAGEFPVPVQRHPARAARPPRAAGRAVGARGRHPHRRDRERRLYHAALF
ncbi:MAG: MgtC/SapB family protein [Oscillospiraceae bacterium]